MRINRQDTNGVKPLLAVGELGYDNYPSGGDIGRVFVGTGTQNIAQAKKSEVVTVDGKVDTHVARIDNPHGVTKAQVGLSNVDNTADSTKVVASAGKWTTGRIINGTTVDGTVNITTSQWGASRNITIGNTLKTVNGSGDVSWTLTEIGAIGTSSPAFTGIPTAPTAAVGTSNTVIATTEFVNAEIANDAIPRVTSTDNAIVRFDGTTGAVQNSAITIDDNGNIGIGTQSFNGFGGTGFKNYIINGDMRIDQWSNGAIVNVTNAGAIACDRFQSTASQTGKITAQQRVSGGVPMGNAQFENCLQIITVSGYSPIASDQFKVAQKIEGLNIANLKFGKYNAKKITLSFWVRSSVVGLHCVSFRNSASDRSYVATYTINTANTFEYKTITINGDTSGTWLYDTGIGLIVDFNLASGSTYNTSTPNQWVSGSYTGATDVVNDIATTGNEFTITGIQLEEGSIATPFEQRPYGLELSLCQRYLPTATGFHAGHASTNGEVYLSVKNRAISRVTPTGLIYSSGGTVYYTNNSSPITNITFFAGNIDSNTLKINPTGTPLTIGQGVMVGLPKILFTGCEL